MEKDLNIIFNLFGKFSTKFQDLIFLIQIQGAGTFFADHWSKIYTIDVGGLKNGILVSLKLKILIQSQLLTMTLLYLKKILFIINLRILFYNC